MPLNDWLARCWEQIAREAMDRGVSRFEVIDGHDMAARAKKLANRPGGAGTEK